MSPHDTSRLTFRPWAREDAPAVLDLYSRPDVYRFLGATPEPVRDLAAAQQRIERWAGLADERGLGLWAVTLRDDPGAPPLGTALLVVLPRSDGGPSDAVEIGWHLHPDAWGRGYATEAGRALVDAARSAGWSTVRAVLYEENVRSVAVCERLGMTRVGRTSQWYGVELIEYRLGSADVSR